MEKRGNLKSQTDDRKDLISFCLGLSTSLLTDILQQAGLDWQRDVSTLKRRTTSEGLGFLTKTLPSMGKAIRRALAGNRLSIPQFRSMRGTVIPHFLKGLLSRVFHSDGEVINDADICAVNDLIQICMLFYKLEVPYDSQTSDKIVNKFIRVDKSLPMDFSHLGTVDNRLEPNILAVANTLIRKVFANFDARDIKPKHGPGAVATGEKPHEKMHFKRIYDSAEGCYPFTEYFFLGDRHLFDNWEDQYWSLQHVAEPQAKVVLVPKDSRGPRLISAEPLEIQFLQQGLGKRLVARIEHHPLTRGHVNFTDQQINRDLALLGSLTGQWATLDLSDASDRVSIALMERLFAGTGLIPYLHALRSTSTILPSGEVVRLRKFAPMGSALCFPVEAVIFWALAAACVHVVGGLPLKRVLTGIYVYGDDIIVRSGYEPALFNYFHYFALRLGESKCCYSGSFRESCGCDAFRGHMVTPIKIKRLPLRIDNSKKGNKRNRFKSSIPPIDGASLASWVSVSNSLFQKGYYLAADYVKNHVESKIPGFAIPLSMRNPQRTYINPWEMHSDRSWRPVLTDQTITASDSAPAWYCRQVPSLEDQVLFGNCPARLFKYNLDYQRLEFHALTIQPVNYKIDDCLNWRELFRHVIADLGTRPCLYSQLRRVKLKRRWVSLAY